MDIEEKVINDTFAGFFVLQRTYEYKPVKGEVIALKGDDRLIGRIDNVIVKNNEFFISFEKDYNTFKGYTNDKIFSYENNKTRYYNYNLFDSVRLVICDPELTIKIHYKPFFNKDSRYVYKTENGITFGFYILQHAFNYEQYDIWLDFLLKGMFVQYDCAVCNNKEDNVFSISEYRSFLSSAGLYKVLDISRKKMITETKEFKTLFEFSKDILDRLIKTYNFPISDDEMISESREFVYEYLRKRINRFNKTGSYDDLNSFDKKGILYENNDIDDNNDNDNDFYDDDKLSIS